MLKKQYFVHIGLIKIYYQNEFHLCFYVFNMAIKVFKITQVA